MLYNYLIRYPFSNKAKEFIKDKNIDLLSVDEDIIKKATLLLLRTINQNIQDKEKQWRNYLKVDDERISLLYVKLYPVSRILLKIVDYNPLYQQFALHYQKQLKYYINKPLETNEFDEIQKDLCPNLKYIQNTEQYALKLVDYLGYDLGDDHKLQYANLEDGNIYFTKLETINLLSSILKKRILKNIAAEQKDLPKLFLDYGMYIKKKILKENTFNIKVINKPEINTFPPCFLNMYNKLIGGQKLSHIENFTVGVFLSNIGYNYNETLVLFKNSPNFDENIAGYQIKKIMEKKYSVPNCNTLKSNGLCTKECNVKHPFQLFKYKKGENK